VIPSAPWQRRLIRALLCSRTFGATRLPAVRLRCAISNTRRATLRALPPVLAEPLQPAREHADAVGQQCRVRRIVDVRFHDGCVDLQAPALDDLTGPAARTAVGSRPIRTGKWLAGDVVCSRSRYRELGKKRGKRAIPEADRVVSRDAVPAILTREIRTRRNNAAAGASRWPAMALPLLAFRPHRMPPLWQAFPGPAPIPRPGATTASAEATWRAARTSARRRAFRLRTSATRSSTGSRSAWSACWIGRATSPAGGEDRVSGAGNGGRRRPAQRPRGLDRPRARAVRA
jgi:hypothetical protein